MIYLCFQFSNTFSNTNNLLQDYSCQTQTIYFKALFIVSTFQKNSLIILLYPAEIRFMTFFWLQKCWHWHGVCPCMFHRFWWNSSHKCCGNLGFPACCMTLDDILLQPTHLTVVAWLMSDHSDTSVSSLFWLPPAACWSWCVFQPWYVSVCAMLDRLQLCVTSLPFATPKSMP